jgi:hypothetical protein
MKKYYLIIILMVFFTFSLKAQDSTKFVAGWANLDFAIPESPAFKVLGTDPSNILKPSSARAIALDVGNYLFTNGPAIPKNLAVEISPLLLNGNCSLTDYYNHRFWYRIGLSFGTNVSSSGSYSTAEGLRFTIIDKTDLRTNDAFIAQVVDAEHAVLLAEKTAIPLYIKQKNLNVTPIQFLTNLDADAALKKDFNAFVTQFIPNSAVKPADMENLRNQYREKLWNAPIWQVGVAALQTSKDSLIKNLSLSRVGLWSSTGLPLGKKGQLLLGLNYSLADSVKWNSTYSLGARCYYGNNEIKAYLQGEYNHLINQNNFTTSVGCEFNISNGIWGRVTLNLVDENGKLSYQPGFNIGLGTGEKKSKL